jgi:hypothetical protein
VCLVLIAIADSVLNQLSTERTHRDGSALTPKPRTPAAQSPDVGNLALGWELTFADTSSRFDHELPEVT